MCGLHATLQKWSSVCDNVGFLTKVRVWLLDFLLTACVCVHCVPQWVVSGSPLLVSRREWIVATLRHSSMCWLRAMLSVLTALPHTGHLSMTSLPPPPSIGSSWEQVGASPWAEQLLVLCVASVPGQCSRQGGTISCSLLMEPSECPPNWSPFCLAVWKSPSNVPRELPALEPLNDETRTPLVRNRHTRSLPPSQVTLTPPPPSPARSLLPLPPGQVTLTPQYRYFINLSY